jgi:hypothetical protein
MHPEISAGQNVGGCTLELAQHKVSFACEIHGILYAALYYYSVKIPSLLGVGGVDKR